MTFYIVEPIINVYFLSTFTILFANVLDITIDKKSLIEYFDKKNDLYLQGTRSLYFNLLLVSPINYVVGYNYLLDTTNYDLYYFKLLGILLTHNVLYFMMHYSVHKFKPIRFIHEFHHKFIINIPSIGNAVSFLEFQTMYVLPFLVSMFLLKPNTTTINVGILIISILNSIIHSTGLKHLPWLSYFVSPGQHCKHHETYTNNYAAPLLNLDKLFIKE